MQRRDFLATLPLSGMALYATTSPHPHPDKKAFLKHKPLLAAVQAHMIPQTPHFPSAKAMQSIDFMEESIFHPSYDYEIRAFIIEGAALLYQREPHFLSYTFQEKERALRAFEEDGGEAWLSRILILTLEALLSDPIYGSNKKGYCWYALNTQGGEPRPKVRYIFS